MGVQIFRYKSRDHLHREIRNNVTSQPDRYRGYHWYTALVIEYQLCYRADIKASQKQERHYLVEY